MNSVLKGLRVLKEPEIINNVIEENRKDSDVEGAMGICSLSTTFIKDKVGIYAIIAINDKKMTTDSNDNTILFIISNPICYLIYFVAMI